MIKKNITIMNKLGLHARASMKLMDCANQFSSHLQIQFKNKIIDAKSIMDLLTLGAIYQSPITLMADGKDEEAAIKALADLIENRFGESE